MLGAGLDTFAYRNRFETLHVIEVDHPATQAWKRDLLGSAGIAIPASVTFVPVDFTKQPLSGELTHSAFRTTEPAFFSWLGVVPYLSRDAAMGTLGWIGSLPSGSEVVFDLRGLPIGATSFLERTSRWMRYPNGWHARENRFNYSLNPTNWKSALRELPALGTW